MTETIIDTLSSEYQDKILHSNDEINNQITIPHIVVESNVSSTLIPNDSIVIPSISNSSISSVIQTENNNNISLPVCTSNSLGKNIDNQ